MKVTAIMYSNNRYYYKEKETCLTTVKNQKVSVEREVIETTDCRNSTDTQGNSAEYVKHAYEVSFKPLDLITNLQLA
jgi:hypothetical protein